MWWHGPNKKATAMRRIQDCQRALFGAIIAQRQTARYWLSINKLGGLQMAYAIMHFFPGGTKEQYEASIAAVHPSRSTLPKGQIFHAAGPTTGGWQIEAVHDSKESWERFRDGTLLPQMQKGIPGGFAGPPTESGFEVHNLQK